MEICRSVFGCNNNQETLLTFRVGTRDNKYPAYIEQFHNEELFPICKPFVGPTKFSNRWKKKSVHMGLNLEPISVLHTNAVFIAE